MFLSFIFYFTISPLLEWITHFLLHKTNNSLHNSHHEDVHKNNFEKFVDIKYFELWPLTLIIIFLQFNFILFVISLFRYWIVHTYIHYNNNPNNYLVNHHMTHHKYKNYNFCVSAVWPDMLFNTLYYKN